jgi:hypothetical protein
MNGLKPVLYRFATRDWVPLPVKNIGYPTWSRDSRYIYFNIHEDMQLSRLEIATGRVEPIHTITGFSIASSLGPWSGWTPEGEPMVMRDMRTHEIYRIESSR